MTMPVKVRPRILGLAWLLVMCLGTSSAALADDNVVLQWNSAMLQAIRNTGFAPVRAARGFAIVHTCMYDAWAAYDPIAVGTRFGGSLRRPAAEHTTANKEKAISYAAYRALVDLFPTQQSGLFDSQMESLGYDPSDPSEDTTTPAGIGNEACAAVLAFRHADGSNQLGDMNNGAPYADYTGYEPVNDPDNIYDPNRWQPLRNPDGTAQVFVAPHWGLVTPFALKSADQFRPGDPAQYGTQEYERQAQEIVNLSAGLDDRRKAIALYWADGPNTETPPGHWNLFAQWVSHRDSHTLDQDVRMFFMLGNALLDASISVWDCKRHYDYIRPISAIRYLYAGQQIQAWGGPGKGTQTINGENFRSYIPTPPFAEYTSGHSAFSASAAQVLRLFTKSGAFGASHTVPAGSSFVEPGIAPSADVTLSWATFEDAANEAGVSRRYGGIHFEEGDLRSRRMGRKIGTLVWKTALTYFNGTAPTAAGADENNVDDDDFDNDGERDDTDTDDDGDGLADDADSDDDNDGVSDEQDSDDDNDGILDIFDSKSTREVQDVETSATGSGEVIEYAMGADAQTVLLTAAAVALDADPLTQPLTVEIYDPLGGLIATSVPTPAGAVAATVPAMTGTYTVRVRNTGGGSLIHNTTLVNSQKWF